MLSGALLLVAGGVALLLWQRPDAVAPDRQTVPPDRQAAPVDPRTAAAVRLLDRLEALLEGGTPRQVVALAPPGDRRAARELTTLRRNVRTLQMTGPSLRYVGTGSPASAEARWVGSVQVSWRLPGDSRDSRMLVPVTFGRTAGAATFVTARSGRSTAVPLWMLDDVSVARTPRSTVIAVGSAARYSRLADRAVVDVRKVLRDWSGRVVVEVPRDQRQLTRALGARPGAYSPIAALATSVDGSISPAAPVHVFVNPPVFGLLGPRGSQIVMSHEATHVAVGAARSSMPSWLLEGFADYVALAHADLPVSQSASQILSRVRRSGVPARLPSVEEFAPDNTRLGASYEAAWLACRLIAQRYGERRLIRFYRASDRAGATTAAFRTVLGTDEQAFTRAWQADLRRLARSTVG